MKQAGRRTVLLLTAIVTMTLVYAGAALAQPSEKIFFGRWLYKDCPGVCTMNPNGSGTQFIKLVDEYGFGESASYAAPSPDGSKIAYVDLYEHALFVINADGSGRTQLAKNPDVDAKDPTWSPDGSKLAYTRKLSSSDYTEIWTINADGSANARLTTARDEYLGIDQYGKHMFHQVSDSEPDWSPDGSKIAFTRYERLPDHTGGYYVSTINATGGGVTKLSRADGNPDWSPDGSKIAFEGTIPQTNVRYYGSSIFVMKADGSGRTPLTNTAGISATSDATPPMDKEPHWSPDGGRIAFTHVNDWDSDLDIRTMNADGSGVTAITAIGDHRLFGWGLHNSPDTTAPTVDEASLDPFKLQTGVQRNTKITATFSEEMNPNTLTTSTVKLSMYNKKKGKYVPVTNTAVSCDSPCKTVTLDPYGTSSTLLGANTKYKVTITTAAKDKAGNALAQNKVWIFTTGSS